MTLPHKKGSIRLSTEFLVRVSFGIIAITIVLSFFTKLIPFLSKQPFFARVMLLLAIIVLYDNIEIILLKMAMKQQ